MGMQLFYNDHALHSMGKVLILSQTRKGIPDDDPKEWAVTCAIKIVAYTDSPSFHDNYGKMMSLRSWLSTPNGTLRWVNASISGSSVGEYLNRSVTVVSHDLPEDPNAVGTWRQECVITFTWKESAAEDSDAIQATFRRTGSASTLTLGNVTSWKEDMRSTRYSPFHSERSQTVGQVTASGVFTADSTKSLAMRRVDLLALKDTWLNELNGRDGLLQYGSAFNGSDGRLVRIDEFNCDINQAKDSIRWNLTASFSRFPNEAGFALAEFNASITEDKDNGEKTLSFSGKVAAASEDIAIAKLGTLRTSVLNAEGFLAGQCTKAQKDKRKVSTAPVLDAHASTNPAIDNSVNADHASASDSTFIELSFSEEYKQISTNLLSWNVRCNESEEVKTGIVTRTYSGRVVAGAASSSAAYTAAMNKAKLLGKETAPLGHYVYQFLTGVQYTAEYRKKEQPDAGVMELVSLEFSFTYQCRGDRVYYEVQSEINDEALGEKTETVSGFVIAPTQQKAQEVYEGQIRSQSQWSGQFLRGERITTSTQGLTKPTVNVSTSPSETAGTTYTEQWQRLDFSFNIIHTRTAPITMKYEIDITKDFVALEQTTKVSGTVYAATRGAAEAAIGEANTPTGMMASWIALYGSRVSFQMADSRERLAKVNNRTTASELQLSAFPFSVSFTKKMEGDGTIIDCDLSEEIQYTGTRYVEQQIPVGQSVIQECGISSGYRTLSGSCTAATEAAAIAWIKRACLLPYRTGTAPTSYAQPPKMTTSFKYMPRVFSETGSGQLSRSEQCKCYVVSFSFTELIPLCSISL